MERKILAILFALLAVAVFTGYLLGTWYTRVTYTSYPYGYAFQGYPSGVGMMGYYGQGMMGSYGNMMRYMTQMMGGNMLVSGGTPYNSNGSLIKLEQAREIAKKYLAALSNPDLELADLEEWEFNFYAEFKEKSTGIKAFQIVIDKYNGIIYPEMGPNMMWNTKYGMMGAQDAMTLTKEQAKSLAQQFLDSRLPGTQAEESGLFYGYYHFDVKKDGKMYGMLDVNGYSGIVWYHTWHGNFIQEDQSL